MGPNEDERLRWRGRLMEVAFHCEVNEEENRGDERSNGERLNARFMLTDLITDATIIDDEDSADLQSELYETLITRVETHFRAQEALRHQALRERWVQAVVAGGTDKGFEEWSNDRD